ncbi:MAG: metallophosphoesterase, partial [Peptostreptococcaceae bacterium]
MKFLFLTDTHFTAKNPASRIDDIQDTIIKKLLDIKQIIIDECIDVVLHGGDMFHTPDVSNRFTGEIAEIFKSYGVPIYVVPGNHDIYGYNNTTIGNTKLGLLEKTGIINILDRTSPLVFNDGGFKIGVEGQEYHAHIDENMTEDFRVYNLSVDYSILITHSMLLDHEFFKDIKHTLINDVITSADLVLAGHYHPGFKEVEKNGVNYFNPGSMLRVDSSTNSFKNMPRVIVFDIDSTGVKSKYVELSSAKKAVDVFSAKNMNAKTYNNTLESFHNKLKNTKLKGISILDLIDDYVKDNNGDVIVADYAKNMISHIDSEKSCDNGFAPSINT